MKPTTQLRRLLQRPQILVAPGAVDALEKKFVLTDESQI